MTTDTRDEPTCHISAFVDDIEAALAADPGYRASQQVNLDHPEGRATHQRMVRGIVEPVVLRKVLEPLLGAALSQREAMVDRAASRGRWRCLFVAGAPAR